MAIGRLLLFALAMILVLSPYIKAQDEYINEFNISNEQVRLDSTWAYLTKEVIQRQINVYRYCSSSSYNFYGSIPFSSKSNCILVIFDIQNKIAMDPDQTEDFFQNYKLKEELINTGKLNENSYTIGEYEKSLTCGFFAPKFGEEAGKLVIEVGIEKVLPEILPKNAKTLVLEIYDTGKEIGLVKSPEVAILVLGASCTGGEFLERVALSTLTSCQSYIKNLERNYAYEGQAKDLLECHNDAIEKLDLAKKSPNVLLQHVEVQAGSLYNKIRGRIQSILCNTFGFWCDSPPMKIEQSSLQKLEMQIQKLQQATPNSGTIAQDARSLASSSFSRIIQKSNETNASINFLNQYIQVAKKKIDRKSVSLNLIYTPSYDFTNAEYKINIAEQKLKEAELLRDQYKFNSAIRTANEGQRFVEESLADIVQEENKLRSFRTESIILIVLFIILLLFYFWKKRRKGFY